MDDLVRFTGRSRQLVSSQLQARGLQASQLWSRNGQRRNEVHAEGTDQLCRRRHRPGSSRIASKCCTETIRCSMKQELLQSTCRSRDAPLPRAPSTQGSKQWSANGLHRNVVVFAGNTGSTIPAITFGSSIAPPQPSVHGMH